MTAGFPFDPPARVLAIGAHPDDIEFGAGATLATWAAAGAELHLLVLTDGSKGTWNPEDDLEALIATRRLEATAAATTLGHGTVHFGNFVDGELQSGEAATRVVVRTIREVQPDIVLGHDPWKRYRLHPDHRHAGWATVDGVVAARDPHFFAGVGGTHHRPSALWLFEADEPNHEVDVAAALPAKVDALLCHRSQWRSTMDIDPDAADLGAQLDAFRDRILGRGNERFRVMDDL
jgi:LmbE family N-acetylglucosaminyl deacetylase